MAKPSERHSSEAFAHVAIGFRDATEENCRERIDVFQRKCFGGTMKNTDIAAAITRLNGAREVIAQDLRS